MALAVLLGVAAVARAAEEPAFELLQRIGEVEIRRYGPAVEAVTPMPASGGSSGSFRRLAGFIFGGNATGESIAMTTPVQRNLGDGVRRMAFFMPAGYDLAELPAPDDSSVTLREVPARTVAVLRFSGRATDDRVGEQRQALAQRLGEEGIRLRGEWLLNQYNPPWTPPFLRRNEIWVEVDWPRAGDAAL